jgi:hypothetical protein
VPGRRPGDHPVEAHLVELAHGGDPGGVAVASVDGPLDAQDGGAAAHGHAAAVVEGQVDGLAGLEAAADDERQTGP